MKEAQSLIPIVCLSVLIVVLFVIPLRIAAYGYIPADDAMRHAAKVISGKDWNQILVLREDIRMDSHPGWHFILAFVHRLTGCNQDGLVVFSVVFLLLLFWMMPLFKMPRPEAWVFSLFAINVMDRGLLARLFLGRPFMVTMSVIFAIFFLWPRLKAKRTPYGIIGILALLIALSTWMHCSWYLFALPVAAFLLAREWRAAFFLAVAALFGVLIGASLTGHPYLFLVQTLKHVIFAFSNNLAARLLVSEFLPRAPNPSLVLFILGMLMIRYMRGKWNIKAIDNPVFILAALAWALCFVSVRFWVDWGLPAIAFWTAMEIQEYLSSAMNTFSPKRVIASVVVALAFYLSITTDVDNRWTYNLTTEYLSRNDPEHAPWLPEKGGVLYSDDMAIFYQTFFKNPDAPWRYMLGFEPTMMPAEDLAVYRNIQWNFGDKRAFEPWVRKMKPSDRLIVRGAAWSPPNIGGLEWHYAASGIWSGRLKK